MRTKIVATLGPASSEAGVIASMLEEGVEAFRVNFSHGDPETWKGYVEALREAERLAGREAALIGDLSGPGIRIGELPGPVELGEHEEVDMALAKQVSGNSIPVPEPAFFASLEPGDTVVIDDGKIVLRILSVGPGKARARVLAGGLLMPRKSVTVKGKEPPLPSLTEKDLKDVELAVKLGFDYLALSFVRGPDAVEQLRGILRVLGAEEVGVLAKIETRSGVENVDEIAGAADGVIIARGDMGMHYNLEEIPSLQKRLVEKVRLLRKPVIVATQFLETMRENPVPTRSEVMDVYNAVLSGVDGLMVTAETAVGKYPVECVKWLRRIIERAEKEIQPPLRSAGGPLSERFAHGVVILAESLGAKMVVYTRGGNTPRRIASHRPIVPVYAGSANPRTRRKMRLYWGIEPVAVEPGNPDDYDEGLKETLKQAVKHGYVKQGDIVVLTYGLREGTSHTIRIQRVT